MNELNFKNGDPGAVRYGNFINYYEFHPPENRLKHLPLDLFDKSRPVIALDIGCNAGDLTISLHDRLAEKGYNCKILGVDIDPTLILRANEKNISENITFMCLNFMNTQQRENVIEEFLSRYKVTRFNCVFCFSVTMWIHLNEGDEGLKLFLKDICEISEVVVIEPQPWKCYRKAVARMKKCNEEFPLFKELKIRNNVEIEIENCILQKTNYTKECETEKSEWERKLLVFKRSHGISVCNFAPANITISIPKAGK